MVMNDVLQKEGHPGWVAVTACRGLTVDRGGGGEVRWVGGRDEHCDLRELLEERPRDGGLRGANEKCEKRMRTFRCCSAGLPDEVDRCAPIDLTQRDSNPQPPAFEAK